MKNTQTRKQKITVFGILATIALLALLAIIFSIGQNTTEDSFASTKAYFQLEQRIFSVATLEDDFADNSLLIILNKEETFNFNSHTVDNFMGFNVNEVINLTKTTGELVQKQMVSEKTNSNKRHLHNRMANACKNWFLDGSIAYNSRKNMQYCC